MTIKDKLLEIREYFEQRADAEYSTDSAAPRGNKEMELLKLVDEVIEESSKYIYGTLVERNLHLLKENTELRRLLEERTQELFNLKEEIK